ncbi:uncharacterized protein N0V89_005402 [Didymosphaeria variabile]|uniref:DUF1330 domain-containing protein n=1 Tax=Didymosphaeria variabile TaxID=1932322 RepID=A0A9W8XNF7_9PLEO|nr:uncharacterized protein N0V89_005402 [Didymosphaeria variabile]KAJ4353672.1 hypothetical protein N0V89_005402 [Didymosphaeria variabile]
MPLCTLHLVALDPAHSNAQQSFLSALKSAKLSPLVLSRVIRWIILPSTFSTEHLLARNIHWDFLIILPGTDALAASLQPLILHTWRITAGVPSRLTQDFAAKNHKMLQPEPGSVPQLNNDALEAKQTTSSAQNLELSAELKDWIRTFSTADAPEAKGAVSMFNLLSFRPDMKSSYLEYGKAFASSIGSSHGGNAKIVGGVTHVNGTARAKEAQDGVGWDEIALAHYPSILHFADMLADKEYQDVNHKYRVPALRDTAILMTSEMGLEGWGEGGKAKL